MSTLKPITVNRLLRLLDQDAVEQFRQDFPHIFIPITVIWTAVASFVILKVIAAVTNGLRVDTQDEIEGLDITQHGEYGYHTK